MIFCHIITANNHNTISTLNGIELVSARTKKKKINEKNEIAWDLKYYYDEP